MAVVLLSAIMVTIWFIDRLLLCKKDHPQELNHKTTQLKTTIWKED